MDSDQERMQRLKQICGEILAAGFSQCERDFALAACAEIESGRAETRFDIRITPSNKLIVRVGILRGAAKDELFELVGDAGKFRWAEIDPGASRS